jgi:hypothetical protein
MTVAPLRPLAGLIAALCTMPTAVALSADLPQSAPNPADKPAASNKDASQKSRAASKPPAPSQINAEKIAEAARRFERALQLFDSGDNVGALAEFKRIFDLLPQPVVLYNIGLVYAAMSRPVDAADALERAINGGGLTPAQLERAKRTLADQQARIGRVMVTCKPEQARIEVDSVEVAQTPLAAPIRVSEGSHIVGAVAEGYAPARKEVLVAGNAEVSVNFELTATQSKQLANLTVRSRYSGADVIVDGAAKGKTPLTTSVTVAAGHHVVELRRPGYVAARREVDVGPGSVGELAFDLTVDASALPTEGATLVLDSSESPAELTVDDERKGVYSGPLRLPRGQHHITVASPGYIPLDRDIMLDGTQTNVVRVVLEPTAETRRNYRANALFHRTWGWIGVIGGAAIAGGGAVLAIVESSHQSDAQAELSAINAKYDNNLPPCDYLNDWAAEQRDNGSLCHRTINDASAKVDNAKMLQTVGYVGIGVGSAVAVTGLVLLLTGGPPDKYEHSNERGAGTARKSRFSIIPGPGQVGSGLRIAF